MNCADFEVLFADYLDGTLDAERRLTVEKHRGDCTHCGEFASDVTVAVGFLERAAEVEPPAELLTRITFGIPHGASAATTGWRSYLRPWLHPVLQPRIAMGMAMTILSFSMLGRFAGIEVRQLKPSDLQPAQVWAALDDRIHWTWERGVKYYENLKLVYELQTTLQEWTRQEEEERRQSRAGNKPATQGKAPASMEGKGSK